MPVEGLQTHDFAQRLHRSRPVLPPLVLSMASILVEMIDEIEYPTPADIARMHERVRSAAGSGESLAEVCGNEGKLCAICPFAAYIPSEFSHASQEIPVCIPWIAVNRGRQKQE